MTELEKKVLDLIDEDEVIAFLQALIRARSDYPPGDTRKICQICLDKLHSCGIDAGIFTPPQQIKNPKDQYSSDLYPSVIGTIKGTGNGPVLLLNAHIDTVPAGDLSQWDHDPFGGELSDGMIYGRGAGDDKGSVCAQIMAATMIKRANIPLKGTLLINPVSDEEANSCRGAKWLRDEGILKPDLAIIGEQTDNTIAVAERAVVFLRITIHGRACHGAMPWEGSNATIHMADLIHALNTQLLPEVQQIKHKYLPSTTLSATHIYGGHQVNVIPETCTLEIDCRLVPGVSEGYILRSLDDILCRLSEHGQRFQYEIEVTNSENGVLTDTDPGHPLIQAMTTSLEEVTGRPAELTGYKQASDGRVFAKLGIPIAIFGPGDPGLGHSPNEGIPVRQLLDATKALALSIVRILA